ncbi:NADH-quinone oxidoreductase [Gluconobacter oxydans]|uniref:NADH-quinone oxidoreductase subunit NuoG n=1 Tax=Gluconobacter thailandicus TaxID=257438 RepID=UPI0002997255|nr:NADH-quinone oxidoreductase subunit NuoG [Gluconobacter thailandicus]AFW01438.1 NADH-quinone oxidoreductase chain G [Gluconobacter oxydans H24]ANQ42908.1 NADH-quinone oxidoreductase [Gluconobacter oxydans]
MVTFHLDGKACESRPGLNLLQACLEAGANLPYFCWHPELGSVGACRQCAVRQFSSPEDQTGRVVMACMMPVTEGTRISISDPEAAELRESVVEWMMINHPHDCPVCEEGGECHLQDMTVMTGHHTRRYRFTKRTHRNQDLGPFVKHEMNRCIACYRCVRFYRDYAGGKDLAAFGSHDSVYFGRAEDGTLENAFSGNLVEICPTGVFTDKPFSEVYTRKWDMRGAPSVCVHCAVGCNIIVNSRQETVRRVLNRYNGEVNRYMLCDRGRFGYGFVNAPSRIRTPLLRVDGQHVSVSEQDAMAAFARFVGDGKIFGIASSRASLESSFSLRELVGEEQFSTGETQQAQNCMDLARTLLQSHPGHIPTLHNMESADAVLVLGEDVCATAPRLGLALRQSVRQTSFRAADEANVPRWLDEAVRTLGTDCPSALYILTPAPTDLDEIALESSRAAPDTIARIGFAVAHLIDPTAPAVPDLSASDTGLAQRIATLLGTAERPLVISGMQYGSPALMQAAANIAAALARTKPQAGLSLSLPDCNSMGLAMIGGVPLEAVIDKAVAGEISTLVIMENDLARHLDPVSLSELMTAVPNVVVIDHTASPCSERADLVLPAAAFTECVGTLVNQEGRAQRFFPAVVATPPVRPAWRWMTAIAPHCPEQKPRQDLVNWEHEDDVIAAMGRTIPALAGAINAAPGSSYRFHSGKIRNETSRMSGRTVIRSHVSVRDQPPPPSPETPFRNSMEGTYGPDLPGALIPYFRAPAWNSVQSLTRFQQEIAGPLRGGDGGVRLLGDHSPSQPGITKDVAPVYHYGADIPPPFLPRNGEILLLPETRLFGSEELSMHSPPVVARSSPAVLRLPETDVRPDRIELRIQDVSYLLPVQSMPGLAYGVAVYPAHMTIPAFAFPRLVPLNAIKPDHTDGGAS